VSFQVHRFRRSWRSSRLVKGSAAARQGATALLWILHLFQVRFVFKGKVLLVSVVANGLSYCGSKIVLHKLQRVFDKALKIGSINWRMRPNNQASPMTN
jgi:hypothetical protein